MHKKSSNRSFGILFFLVFLGFGLWPLTKEMSPNIYLITISVIFLILGLLNSKLLSPLNNLWIKFGEILGKVIAPIVMAVVYFLILTPISLLVRLFGKDLIEMKFNNNVKSYWIKRKKHLGTMDKQF
ncbi:SxtJ family membrane protein [Candidatus Pelagibacter bacterium]|nr:SxtJ family membrane protein [Candidatus Pelagibacter bacterium]